MQMVESTLKIFNAFCLYFKDRETPYTGKEGEAIINNFALFSVFWGIGVVLEETSRPEFVLFISKLIFFENIVEIYKLIIDKPWEPNKLTTSLPEDAENLYDYVFDL